MYQANTTMRRYGPQYRKRSIVQRLLTYWGRVGTRPMSGFELFACGCFAGIVFAALIIAAFIH